MKDTKEFKVFYSFPHNPSSQELITILDCAKKLLFRGQESISRLKALNSLAHDTAKASLLHIIDEEDFSYAERQLEYMDCFVRNQHSLNGLEILTGQNSEIGFEKIKNRLIDNIGFFIQREIYSPIRQKMLLAV